VPCQGLSQPCVTASCTFPNICSSRTLVTGHDGEGEEEGAAEGHGSMQTLGNAASKILKPHPRR